MPRKKLQKKPNLGKYNLKQKPRTVEPMSLEELKEKGLSLKNNAIAGCTPQAVRFATTFVETGGDRMQAIQAAVPSETRTPGATRRYACEYMNREDVQALVQYFLLEGNVVKHLTAGMLRHLDAKKKIVLPSKEGYQEHDVDDYPTQAKAQDRLLKFLTGMGEKADPALQPPKQESIAKRVDMSSFSKEDLRYILAHGKLPPSLRDAEDIDFEVVDDQE